MSDKKNQISDEEMKAATGGAGDASDRVTDRAGHTGSVEADARGDALPDGKLDAVRGGTAAPSDVPQGGEIEGTSGGGGNKRTSGALNTSEPK